MSLLKRAVAKLGGAVLTEAWSEGVTHLVAREIRDGLCTRTAGYLNGVARGIHVVSYGWVRASLKENCWKPEESYQLLGDSVKQQTDAPARSRADRVAGRPRLFDGLLFCLWGAFEDLVNKENEPPWKSLVELIEGAGGSVLHLAGNETYATGCILQCQCPGDLCHSAQTAVMAAYIVRSRETVRAEGAVDTEELLRPFQLGPQLQVQELFKTAPIVTSKWLIDSISCYALCTDTANYMVFA
eukprot:tig00001387_g8568.t1